MEKRCEICKYFREKRVYIIPLTEWENAHWETKTECTLMEDIHGSERKRVARDGLCESYKRK